MPTFRVTSGALTLDSVGGNYPSNELPGSQPGIDNSLPSGGHPWVPGHLPAPPPAIWPPLTPSNPIQPAPPGTPPGAIWPPLFAPVDPGYGIGEGAHPGHGLPTPPSGTLPARPPVRPDNTLPGGQGGVVTPPIASNVYWVIVGVPGIGWRYTAIDPSVSVGHPLPPHAEPK